VFVGADSFFLDCFVSGADSMPRLLRDFLVADEVLENAKRGVQTGVSNIQ
jgi:hypothetical protein